MKNQGISGRSPGLETLTGLKKRFAQMRGQQEKCVPVWREISRFVTPKRGNFIDEPPNQGARRDDKLIDATSSRALGILQAGMQGGMTSPSRSWFKLQVSEPELAVIPSVMLWSDEVKDRIATVLGRSNVYNCLHGIYGEISAFGIGALFIDDDWDEVINGKLMTAGDYYVSFDARDKPSAFGRTLWMTAAQMAKQFGTENVSEAARHAVRNNAPETWFKVCHLICAREDNDFPDISKRFPWISVYWDYQSGTPDREKDLGGALSVGGYEEFPVLVPRWEVRGGDFYGYGPGWEALGESKTLQELRKDYLTAQQMAIMPPVYGTGRERVTELFPGGVTYTEKDAALKPVYQVNPDIQGQLMAINESRNMINQIFFSDLFLMIAASDNRNMTAFEVQVRQEEKLQMLGPVIERLEHELLDPLIARVFGIMNRRGMFPEPPEELQGREIKIEYVSMLALAQRSSGLTDMNNLMGLVGGLGQMQPEVTDKLDADAIVDQYVRMTNIPPAVIRSDEAVAEMRRQRAAQAQQAQEMAAMQQMAATAKQGAGAVKDLSGPLQGGSPLEALTGGIMNEQA